MIEFVIVISYPYVCDTPAYILVFSLQLQSS
jgi:hypothetical protein